MIISPSGNIANTPRHYEEGLSFVRQFWPYITLWFSFWRGIVICLAVMTVHYIMTFVQLKKGCSEARSAAVACLSHIQWGVTGAGLGWLPSVCQATWPQYTGGTNPPHLKPHAFSRSLVLCLHCEVSLTTHAVSGKHRQQRTLLGGEGQAAVSFGGKFGQGVGRMGKERRALHYLVSVEVNLRENVPQTVPLLSGAQRRFSLTHTLKCFL